MVHVRSLKGERIAVYRLRSHKQLYKIQELTEGTMVHVYRILWALLLCESSHNVLNASPLIEILLKLNPPRKLPTLIKLGRKSFPFRLN